ncbi:MAG: hypothetical protein JWM33_3180, partial [Caulobacteraceae bacterium]|nr:hypothetical protein [Caulobacteraceae bacterium]
LFLMGAASVPPASKPQGQAQGSAINAPASHNGGEEMTAYDRESLGVDRSANHIAEASNQIAADQRTYAFLQTILGGAGVLFTGVAAFWAWRATKWAKEAARAAGESAKADNASLVSNLKAAADAREDADKQEARHVQQLLVANQAADAARHANEITSANFAEARRPWLALADVRPTAFNSGKGGPFLELEITIQNSGAVPALGVHFAVQLFDGHVADMPVWARLSNLAAAGPVQLVSGAIAFPGVPDPLSLVAGFVPEELEALRRATANQLGLWLIAVAYYRSPIDSTWHYTGKSFSVEGLSRDRLLSDDVQEAWFSELTLKASGYGAKAN